MARIRTIKPDFFRHEALYEAERATGLPLRVAFAGLWTAADREGRFRWAPRQLKLDCLPYDDVDFSSVLDALERYGFVRRYEVGGVTYGEVPSWHAHQAINQREAQSKIPAPPEQGSRDAGDANNNAPSVSSPAYDVQRTCTHMHAHGEGKGKEGERKGDADADARARAVPVEPDPPPKSKSLMTEEAIDLADELLVIAGHEVKFVPPGWCGAAMRVQSWLSAGWPREIIVAAVKGAAARKTGPPASSVQFFEKAIAEEVARQAAPLPQVKVRQAETLQVTHGKSQREGGVVAAARRLREQFESQARDGIEGNGDAVLRLSKG